MSINFHDTRCQSTTYESLFGLCDDQNGTSAYIDTANQTKWIAVVNNIDEVATTFTAIDNCIPVYRDNGEMDSCCDGMLTYTNNIVFLELKEIRTGGWIAGGIEQLKNTILIYSKSYNILKIKRRRAFLVNKKFPKFQYGHQERMEQFKKEVGVRLIIHNTIKI